MAKKILIALAIFILISGLSVYNAFYVNTKQFRIREEKLSSELIRGNCDGLLIGYFSDLLLNDLIDDEYIDRFAESLASFEPDIIIFGGDLLDEGNVDAERIEHLTAVLSSLEARYGKYAVHGDIDEKDPQRVDAILHDAGFEVLANSSALIAIDAQSYIDIVGISPLIGGNADPALAFANANANYYTIAVSHCPDIFDSLPGYGLNYLLSGHSLGGQVYLPLLSLFGRDYGCRKYYHGKTTRNDVTVDITNGLGRTGTNARFLADAEFVLYTLHHKEND